MARRIYAGERWWVDGTRSHIECLYRPHSQNCPTHFVIAVADREEGGDGRCGAEERGLDEDVTGPSREEGGAGGGHRPQEGGGRRKRGKGPVKVQRGEQEVVRFDVGGRWKDIPWKGGSGRDPGM